MTSAIRVIFPQALRCQSFQGSADTQVSTRSVRRFVHNRAARLSPTRTHPQNLVDISVDNTRVRSVSRGERCPAEFEKERMIMPGVGIIWVVLAARTPIREVIFGIDRPNWANSWLVTRAA